MIEKNIDTLPVHPLLWHTLPLHYVPYLLYTGELLSAARIDAEGHPLLPRHSAIRRKTKLGLADFVHLSLSAETPLLLDKKRKGYSHALVAFDRAATLAIPGVALLKYNTKRWAHRDDFVPVTEEAAQKEILREHARGTYPSLEVLVPKRLPLTLFATTLLVDSIETATRLWSLTTALHLAAPPLFPSALLSGGDPAPIYEYFAQCQEAGAVLPPPLLPFD